MIHQKDASTDFGRQVRAGIRGLWKGHFDLIGFVDHMTAAIFRSYELAWREGESQCGIAPAERSLEESLALDNEIQNDLGYIFGLGDAILKLKDRSEAGGKKAPTITSALNRGGTWENRPNAVRNLAQRMACSDQKLRWVLGRAEHCVDCLNYSDRVYRASIWAKYDIRPQHPHLACHGYKCQCRFEPTTAPAWPGRPPGMTGG